MSANWDRARAIADAPRQGFDTVVVGAGDLAPRLTAATRSSFPE